MSLIGQSRKRKIEIVSAGSTKASFFRQQPLKYETVHRGSSNPPRISTSMKTKKLHVSFEKKLHTSKKGQSTSKATPSSQPISDLKSKKDLKKSIAELPKLFSRLFRLSSKSDTESTSSVESKCSAVDSTNKRRWTKFMMHLAGNRISTSQQDVGNSIVPYRDPSGPSTSKVDRVPSKLKLFTSGSSASSHQETVTEARKTCKSASHPAASEAHSALPRLIGSPYDDFVLYPKRGPFYPKIQSRNLAIRKRHPESNPKSSFRKMVNRFKHQPSSFIKSSQTVPPDESDPFGDVPPISDPVLEPILVRQSSWRKVQRKVSKRFSKRFYEPMKFTNSDSNEGSFIKNPAKSVVLSHLSMSAPSSSRESYRDGPSIVSPVQGPNRIEAALSSSMKNHFYENIHYKNFEINPTQSAYSNGTSLSTEMSLVIKSSHQPHIPASPSETTFTSIVKPIQMPVTFIAMQNEIGTRQMNSSDSIKPQFQGSTSQDVNRSRCHADSTPITKISHLLHAASSYAFTQPSTQILKTVQEVSTPVSSSTRSLQPHELAFSTVSTSCDPMVDVKFCPESAQLGHLASGLFANFAAQSILPSEQHSGVGQVFTSTMSPRSLPEKKMVVPGTSSTNALTSDLSYPPPFTAYPSTSSSSLKTKHKKPAHLSAKKSNASKSGHSSRIMKKLAKTQASYSTTRGEPFHFGTASSSLSSSSSVFENSTETINSTSGHKASLSLTNLLQADSVTSESVGSDAGNSSDLLQGINFDQIELAASSSLAADKNNDPHNTPGRESSSVHQKSVKMKKTQSKGKFLGKLMRVFSTTEKKEYNELTESKSEPPVPERKILVPKSKKNQRLT